MPDYRHSGRHLKIQDGSQVSCRYKFHMNRYIVMSMCATFGSPVVNIILKYARLYINGDHF